MVIFSDPMCPFCIDFVPEVIDEIVSSKTKKIALFYYHFPLSIHPRAETIVKATIAAEADGVDPAELISKVYNTDFEEVSKDEKAVLLSCAICRCQDAVGVDD